MYDVVRCNDTGSSTDAHGTTVHEVQPEDVFEETDPSKLKLESPPLKIHTVHHEPLQARPAWLRSCWKEFTGGAISERPLYTSVHSNRG